MQNKWKEVPPKMWKLSLNLVTSQDLPRVYLSIETKFDSPIFFRMIRIKIATVLSYYVNQHVYFDVYHSTGVVYFYVYYPLVLFSLQRNIGGGGGD